MATNSKYLKRALLLLVTLGIAGNAHSSPYRFQVTGAYSQNESEAEDIGVFIQGGTTVSDAKTFGVTYYLNPVDATTGPLAERAFLSKSAWLSGSYSRSEADLVGDNEVNSTIVNTRFVTQTGLIFELDYLGIDDADELATYSFGAGKYLDGSTTAILKINHSEDDLNVLSFIYRKVGDSATSGARSAVTVGLGYVDTESRAGFQLNFNGTQYISDIFSVSAGMLLLRIGRNDTITFALNSEYFFTDSIYFGLGYLQASDEFTDFSTLGLTFGARL